MFAELVVFVAIACVCRATSLLICSPEEARSYELGKSLLPKKFLVEWLGLM